MKKLVWFAGLKIPQGHWQHITIGHSAYYFPFDFHRNYTFISYCFQVIASYLSKVAYFDLPHLHLSPPHWGCPCLNFAAILGVRNL